MAASSLVDLVKIYSKTTGTGAIGLGSAVGGYRGVEALENGATYSYSIQQEDQFETGKGTYLAAGQLLVRTPVITSNGQAAIDLQPNAAVAFVALSEDILARDVLQPLYGLGAPLSGQGLPGQVYYDLTPPVTLYGPKDPETGWGSGVVLQGQDGTPGTANSTFITLADMKAAPLSNRSYILTTPNGATTYGFVAGDFTGQANDITVVQLNSVPLNQGALVANSTYQTASNVVALETPPAGYIVSDNMTRGLQAGLGGRGRNNRFDGYQSGKNATGVVYSNIGIGTGTLANLTGGTTGAAAYGSPLPTASGNLAIGDLSGSQLTSGYENLLFGICAGQNLVAGRWNTVVGPYSLLSNQNGECNTVLGSYSLVTFGGSNATAIGWAVMENHSTGTNVGIGYNALGGSVTSDRCTAVGTLNMRMCQSGIDSTSMGHEALKNFTNPTQMTAVGSYSFGSGSGSIANGTALGCEACLNARGDNNTGVGYRALYSIGDGGQNTALGSIAGRDATNLNNTLALGFNAQPTKSNQVVLGNEFVTETLIRGVIRGTVVTVANLPAASVAGAGARAFVSDATVATFATIVVGGSTNMVPVYCTGADWRIG